jgi:hypothetical protein
MRYKTCVPVNVANWKMNIHLCQSVSKHRTNRFENSPANFHFKAPSILQVASSLKHSQSRLPNHFRSVASSARNPPSLTHTSPAEILVCTSNSPFLSFSNPFTPSNSSTSLWHRNSTHGANIAVRSYIPSPSSELCMHGVDTRGAVEGTQNVVFTHDKDQQE